MRRIYISLQAKQKYILYQLNLQNMVQNKNTWSKYIKIRVYKNKYLQYLDNITEYYKVFEAITSNAFQIFIRIIGYHSLKCQIGNKLDIIQNDKHFFSILNPFVFYNVMIFKC